MRKYVTYKRVSGGANQKSGVGSRWCLPPLCQWVQSRVLVPLQPPLINGVVKDLTHHHQHLFALDWCSLGNGIHIRHHHFPSALAPLLLVVPSEMGNRQGTTKTGQRLTPKQAADSVMVLFLKAEQ